MARQTVKNNYLRRLGLSPGAAPEAVKSAYRALAHQNHPDKFSSPEAKLTQTRIMAELTEAYQYLLSHPQPDASPLEQAEKFKESDDTILYQKGVVFYQKYFDTFFKMFSERELITPEDKRKCLLAARQCFSELLREYPHSDWAWDAEDRLRRIDQALRRHIDSSV